MDIITGYIGEPHISSEQDRDINIGIVGEGSYVLATGLRMEPEVQTGNEVRIKDGVIMHQGCAASIKKNTYDSVMIANGSQGMKRTDLIVARYQREAETNIESMNWVVIQGTPAETDPVVPEYVSGDIQAGDTVADMPMYKVHLDGLNITSIEKVFTVVNGLKELNSNIYDKKVLWSHAGIFLNAGQSITLSEKLSEQKQGIVLVLSRYESGASQNYGYCTYFIPKECLDFGADNPGFDIPLVKYSDGSIVTGSKYIYVSDDKIGGAATNGTSPNSGWVFRYAIGV